MADLTETKIELQYIGCIDCLHTVVDALRKLEGVIEAKHNPEPYPPWVWVQYDGSQLTVADLEETIEQIGYEIKGKKYPGFWEGLRGLFGRRAANRTVPETRESLEQRGTRNRR